MEILPYGSYSSPVLGSILHMLFWESCLEKNRRSILSLSCFVLSFGIIVYKYRQKLEYVSCDVM